MKYNQLKSFIFFNIYKFEKVLYAVLLEEAILSQSNIVICSLHFGIYSLYCFKMYSKLKPILLYYISWVILVYYISWMRDEQHKCFRQLCKELRLTVEPCHDRCVCCRHKTSINYPPIITTLLFLTSLSAQTCLLARKLLSTNICKKCQCFIR